MPRGRVLSAVLFLAVSGRAVFAASEDANADRATLEKPLHFDVNLVQVDVVVTDSHGRRIPGLSAGDFEVLQDGKRQTITHFTWVPAPAAAATPAPAQAPRQLTRSEARRVFLIYIDDRIMSFADFTSARSALRQFIDKEFQPGDLWSFFRTTGGPGAWRAFSPDPEQARAAIDHMTWLTAPPIQRGLDTLELGLHQALAALSTMPGRKALVLVNCGISLYPRAQYGDILGSRRAAFQSTAVTMYPIIRKLADAANRVSAVIYSIDDRRLQVLQPGAADEWYGGPENIPRSGAVLAEQSLLYPRMEHAESQNVPRILAEMTGGLAFPDSNDLVGALHNIAADDQDYYLLGWNPGDKAFDPKGTQILYHSIKVRMRAPGLTARSRAGFFGVPDGERTHISARNRMLFALHSPFREEDIPVELTAGPGNSAAGPNIEALLHVGPQGVHFITDDHGCRMARLDVATEPRHLGDESEVYPPHGQLAEARFCGSSAERVARDGFVVALREQVKPGPYVFHVVVRNLAPGEGAVLAGPKPEVDSDPNAPAPEVSIGSASEFVNVPNPRAEGPALSGITLALHGAAQSSAAWRVPVPGDPAIRDFHPGDAIAYQASILGRVASEAQSSAEMRVLCAGKQIHAEPVQTVEGALRGVYQIDQNAAPGQYLLGIATTDKRKQRAVQWINFQVVKP